MIGRVVSAKMKNTVTVLVERTAIHPLYKKKFLRTKKYLVDSKEEVKEGDVVEIIKIKPMSKNKHFRVAKVIGKNLSAINEEHLKAEAEEIIAEVMPEEKEEVKVAENTEEKAEQKKEEKQRKK